MWRKSHRHVLQVCENSFKTGFSGQSFSSEQKETPLTDWQDLKHPQRPAFTKDQGVISLHFSPWWSKKTNFVTKWLQNHQIQILNPRLHSSHVNRIANPWLILKKQVDEDAHKLWSSSSTDRAGMDHHQSIFDPEADVLHVSKGRCVDVTSLSIKVFDVVYIIS